MKKLCYVMLCYDCIRTLQTLLIPSNSNMSLLIQIKISVHHSYIYIIDFIHLSSVQFRFFEQSEIIKPVTIHSTITPDQRNTISHSTNNSTRIHDYQR